MPTSTCCGWLRHHARRFSQSPWHSGKGSHSQREKPFDPIQTMCGKPCFFFVVNPTTNPLVMTFTIHLYPFLIYGSTWHGWLDDL